MTQTQQLTHHERNHLIHCLRVAATQFDHDAATFKDHLPEAEASCLAREFERYAAEARELADSIEDADSIAIEKEARR